MSDPVVRLGIVLVIVVLAATAAWIARRLRRPPHPAVRVGEAGERPGVVLFTSTTCPTCKEAIALLERLGVGFREITNDLEPQRFASWGVTAVPLTVVVDADGDVVDTFSGIPRTRALRASLRRAGLTTG